MKTGLKNDYKSAGERRIADFLSRSGVKFEYESPTVVYDMNCQLRVWYPDFKVGGSDGLIVEYAGMQNNTDYDRGIAKKKKLYKQNGLDALFLYPQDIYKNNWQDNVAGKIRRSQASKASPRPQGSYLASSGPYRSYRPPKATSLRGPLYQNR
jgi:hypothetical protein